MSLKSTGMVCVATDSFRLAEKTIPGVTSKDTGDILIPVKHVNELVYILEHMTEAEIQVRVEDFQLSVSGDGAKYSFLVLWMQIFRITKR
jgi:DNA polymerase III sliding clamp (beta) subunit (PCNA family)